MRECEKKIEGCNCGHGSDCVCEKCKADWAEVCPRCKIVCPWSSHKGTCSACHHHRAFCQCGGTILMESE